MSFQTKIFSFVTSLLFLVLQMTPEISSADLEKIQCGIDHSQEVIVGKDIPLKIYPWVGILYYVSHDITGEVRAVTTVVLIQQEFVLAAAADIGPMPKYDFRESTRVVLGGRWDRDKELKVRSYVIHPEYGETLNTVALVQLQRTVLSSEIIPVCPPPNLLRDPEFYVIKFDEDYNNLKKQVIPVAYVPGKMCKDFYVSANLYAKKMRPPHVACVVALEDKKVCVWEAGAALVSRDAWGRWQLLGLGVRGPGCGAPSRYLDMMSYYPWIEASINKFKRLTISKINKQKYVLRSGGGSEEDGIYKQLMRFGACEPWEKKNIVYREWIFLETDNTQYQTMAYNMTVHEDVEYSCLTLELVNASAVSEMKVVHVCPRSKHGPCYTYGGSSFHIAVEIIFSDKCTFEMCAWGYKKNMTLLDTQEWKWEEGTYYEDFHMLREEYRGQADMTGFGFEPLDEKMWIPEYDFWTTTPASNLTTTPQMRFQEDGTEPQQDKKGGSATRGPMPPAGKSDPESSGEFQMGIRF